jgi:hypothetical protein
LYGRAGFLLPLISFSSKGPHLALAFNRCRGSTSCKSSRFPYTPRHPLLRTVGGHEFGFERYFLSLPIYDEEC